MQAFLHLCISKPGTILSYSYYFLLNGLYISYDTDIEMNIVGVPFSLLGPQLQMQQRRFEINIIYNSTLFTNNALVPPSHGWNFLIDVDTSVCLDI